MTLFIFKKWERTVRMIRRIHLGVFCNHGNSTADRIQTLELVSLDHLQYVQTYRSDT